MQLDKVSCYVLEINQLFQTIGTGSQQDVLQAITTGSQQKVLKVSPPLNPTVLL